MKILFIEEDETDFLDTVMALANEAHCEVAHVQTTQEAMLYLVRESYEIVLLNLPDCQGLQTTENLHHHRSDTAILILADYDDEERVITAVGRVTQG